MTYSTNTVLKIASALTLAASLGLGGCAADAGSSDEFYPHENSGETAQEGTGAETEAVEANDEYVNDEVDAELLERPVVLVSEDDKPVIAYRAIEFPAELETMTREIAEDLIIELDIEIPIDQFLQAQANDELIIIPMQAAYDDDNVIDQLNLYPCEIDLGNGLIGDGFCVEEGVETVRLDRDALVEAGFDVENPHADLPTPELTIPGPIDPPEMQPMGSATWIGSAHWFGGA